MLKMNVCPINRLRIQLFWFVADFQHRFPFVKFQKLGLKCHSWWLGYGLIAQNLQSPILISKNVQRRIQKEMSRNFIHGIQNPFIRDSFLSQSIYHQTSQTFVLITVRPHKILCFGCAKLQKQTHIKAFAKQKSVPLQPHFDLLFLCFVIIECELTFWK